MEWIVVLVLLVSVCVLSLGVLLSFRWGRMLLLVLAIVVALPVFYLATEVLSFYVVGRSMVPSVGVFWGVFFPAPSYFKPILSMPMKPKVFRYGGTFRCRHFGRHQLVLEIPIKENNVVASMDFEVAYTVLDSSGNILLSGRSKWDRQVEVYKVWPYVCCARFDVPSQLPRNDDLQIRLEVSEGMMKFLERTPCSRFVVMKVSDE